MASLLCILETLFSARWHEVGTKRRKRTKVPLDILLAVDHLKVILREPTSLLPNLAGKLLPIAFEPIPVHLHSLQN